MRLPSGVSRKFASSARSESRRGAECGPAEASLLKSLDAMGDMERLDAVIGPVQRMVRALPLGPARDVLHGRQLGHPLHPVLVQIPMGAWLSAAVLDLVPGRQRSARLLVGVGVVSAVPAAWAGWVDWAEQHEQQMRVGLVHAASNATAVGLYAASWVARGAAAGAGARSWGSRGSVP